MCEIEPEGYCDVWNETERKARKSHICSSCARPIKRGEKYIVHFSVYDGTTSSGKCCSDCNADRKEFASAHHGMGSSPGEFPWLLVDCIAEGDEESETKWKPMLEKIRSSRREHGLHV